MQRGLTRCSDRSPSTLGGPSTLPPEFNHAVTPVSSDSNSLGHETKEASATLPMDKNGGKGVAALLFLTHILELAVMAIAVFSKRLQTVPLNGHNATHISSPSLAVPLYAAQLATFILPMLVVTAVSLAWTLKAQDFSGRSAARLVCWTLHVSQASLVWRYLKVQLAYDYRDVAELGIIRFIQVHIHSLPFLIVHAITILASPREIALSLSLMIILLTSVVVTTVASSTVGSNVRTSSLTPPSITQICYSPVHARIGSGHHDDAAARMVIGFTTFCLLWCRIISLSALFCLHTLWASVLLIIHWLGAVLWLVFRNKSDSQSVSSYKQTLHKIFLGYLLVWDWHVFNENASAFNVCSRPFIPVAFYMVVSVQNVATTASWYAAMQSKSFHPLFVTTLVSVVVVQVVAMLLLILSYLYCSSLLPSWSSKKECCQSISRKPSLVNNLGKASSTDSSVICNPVDGGSTEGNDSSSHTNLRNKLETMCSIVETAENKTLTENSLNSTSAQTFKILAPSSPPLPYPAVLASKIFAQRLPPSMFSYSNDMLPHNLHNGKSERSSTENGSFNSRNTNTLVNSPNHTPEYIIHRAHGSFSESFSSLSCGTVRKVVTSTPKVANNTSNIVLPSISSQLKRHTSCKNGFCHCKIFDKVSNKCRILKERETEGEKDNDDDIQTCNDSSTCDRRSAPKVSVVRGAHRFQVVCVACLSAHDPLLTSCQAHYQSSKPPSLNVSCGGIGHCGSSTAYPSDTELTATVDTLSSASAESHSSYTTWPVGRGHSMARLLMREDGVYDYVTAWLRHQQVGGNLPPMPPPGTILSCKYTGIKEHGCASQPPVRKFRHKKGAIQQRLLRCKPTQAIMQDLETVV